MLRTIEQYNLDVIKEDVSNSGIKEACVWNNVCGFNVLDQVGMDVMHDVIEGVGKYDLEFLIRYYVEDLKLFSLQILNERLVCFDYGPDKCSKPFILLIDYIRKNSIRLSASEMLTLIRYFGLLIGDLVPRNNPIWWLYISLRHIVDIVLSTSIQKDCCVLLKTLVSEHNNLYIKYSKLDLKPKYYFMQHYHTIIEQLGPVVNRRF